MRSQTLLGLAISTASMVLVGCSNPSGIYTRTSNNQAEMFQIIRSKDGRLSGRYETVSFDANGNVSRQAADFEGSQDGSQAILTAHGFLGISQSLTGTFSGNRFSVSWSGMQEDFSRSSAAGFDRDATKVRDKAAEVVGHQQAANARFEEAQLRQGIALLRSKTPEVQDRLSAAGARYGALQTERGERLEAARRLAQQPGGGVAANGQAVAADGDNVAMNGVRIGVQGLGMSVATAYRAQGDRAQKLKAICAKPSGKPAPDLTDICGRVQQDRLDLNALGAQFTQLFAQASNAVRDNP